MTVAIVLGAIGVLLGARAGCSSACADESSRRETRLCEGLRRHCGDGRAGGMQFVRRHPRGSRSAAPVGGSGSIGDLRITGVYVPAPASPDVAAAYFSVQNTGTAADELVKVASSVSTDTSLHTYDSSGTSMVPLAELEIPAGQTKSLVVGSTHVMIMNAKPALKTGDTVTLTLTFTHAGTVKIATPVLDMTGSQVDHTGMSDMTGMGVVNRRAVLAVLVAALALLTACSGSSAPTPTTSGGLGIEGTHLHSPSPSPPAA